MTIFKYRPDLYICCFWLNRVVWGYLFFTLALLFTMLIGGDRWWPATIILFGPRWIALLPLVFLVPWAIWCNFRLLYPLLTSALIISFPVMGFCLSFGKVGLSDRRALRVLTCNLNAGKFNSSALISMICASGADILVLQECPRELRINLPTDWHTLRDGELGLFSRYPLWPDKSLQSLHSPLTWSRASLLKGVVQTPYGDIAICNIHLPSPRYGLQNILDRNTFLSFSRAGLLIRETAHRMKTSREVQRTINSSALPVIIAGDFNMPVESAIYRQVWSGYSNAFSTVGRGFGWTERASIAGVALRVRIDHILAGQGLVPRFCEVGPDIGSDHLPVIADVALSML